MTDYQPRSRRPIAQMFRQTAGVAVAWCVRRNIHPNLVSYSSIVAAALAGLCFWQSSAFPWLLIPAVGFCYLRLWLNMLDGMVALASGKASLTGEIANELPDRLSDVIIFVGAGYSGLCEPSGGYWAAIFALLVAYVGTMGQALGVQREYSGIMSKPWRMVTLHVGAWITLGLLWWRDGRIAFGGWTVLDYTFLAIVVGCIHTIWLRLSRIVKALQAKNAANCATAEGREA
jgi:phosphatidylglycerophosphate synthase